MRKHLRNLWNDKRGNALILAAAALPLLLGSAGLATDTIQWALWKRQLQRAADSAAIAGVYDRVAHTGGTDNVPTAVDHDLALNQHTNINLMTNYPQLSYPADAGSNKNQVRVVLRVQRSLSFSSMFMAAAPMITATAQAATVGVSGEFCVLSLQNNSKTGIQATGNNSITMDCGMMTNSTATNAAAGQGSANVTATTLAASGGIQQSKTWNINSYQPYSPSLEDPYADLTPSAADGDFDNCVDTTTAYKGKALTVNNGNTGLVINGADAATSGGACFASLSVQSNRALTLKNGVFVVNGGNADIQGNLILDNAVLLLTNKDSSTTASIGKFDNNASGTISATAMTSGKWAGMALYQDRRAVDDAPTGNITASSPNKVNGNSTQKVTGVLYFPSQQLTYNGTGTGTATCTQFVAKRIYWSGNSGLNNFTKNCTLKGITAITAPQKVRLVA
ncbi:pilus assembly protein TadG-related protein [Sphingomonas alba]|uniref:Pilus assembly protein TadG-related protein n=1 Tax=Sphingomonas alba TaxID=2908208 RepID=A0ABT0RK65_9SPHN|nr:pilus assembly protein TadG-related protein [Sphingomonas alba]MCL6682985.1 pilus assembly protein TadG-related protein [Sphingomonas alba]